MKKRICIVLSACFVLALAGCGKVNYPDFADDVIGFQMGEYIDVNDDDASYGTIEYEGRLYIGYGTIGNGKSLHRDDIDQCVGYVIMNQNSSSYTDLNDRDTRIYTLQDDPDHNYLMEHYEGTDLMNPPSFWRAVDTKGQEIDTPDYIESLGYLYWYQ